MKTGKDSPAGRLEGRLLASGWLIGKKLQRVKGSSGGTFCVSYIATKDGEEAFVKAIDFIEALQHEDPLKRLVRLGAEASWEREVLEFCALKQMSRVVKYIAHEYVFDQGYEGEATRQVSCLVIEKGERDLNNELRTHDAPRKSWLLLVLRDVAIALDQLHSSGIAHLDVKPSNVVAMKTESTARSGRLLGKSPSAKLTDLGRVVRKGIAGPWDSYGFTGDPVYKPPEKLYGFDPPEWRDDREAADSYMLGSLAVFLFTRVPMHILYDKYIPENFKDRNWRGDFDGPLIDVLVDAQSKAIDRDISPQLPEAIRDELVKLILQLTHPDPRKRGDPRARRQGRIGLETYHQKFLRLSVLMEQKEISAA